MSVVIPAFNRADLLPQTLLSVFAQTQLPAEVIVVDDASTDGTAAVAESHGARVIRHERNAGEGATRNTGINAARQEWLALLDSDDEWLPNHLANAWPFSHGRAMVASSGLAVGGPDGPRFIGARRRKPVALTPETVWRPENIVPASGVLVRRDAALAVGGYPVNVPQAADLEFYLRLLEHGSGVLIPDAGVLYRIHPAQISQDRSRMRSGHLAAINRHTDRPWYDERQVVRWTGTAAWDEMRMSMRRGDTRGALAQAKLIAQRPERALGVVELLSYRLAMRRRGSRYASDGGKTTALMPGAVADAPDRVADATVDLRGMSLPAALAHLARRPTAEAVMSSPGQRIGLRLLGVRPVDPARSEPGPASHIDASARRDRPDGPDL